MNYMYALYAFNYVAMNNNMNILDAGTDVSHIFLVWQHYLLNWYVILLEDHYGLLMGQIIYLVVLLMEHYQDMNKHIG